MPSKAQPVMSTALAVLALAGCYQVESRPVLPPPVRLASATGFVIMQPAVAGSPAGSCVARRADGAVSHVSGDTIFLVHVSIVRQPKYASPCPHGGPSYVVLSPHPDLHAEVARVSWERSVVGIALITPLAFVFLLVMLGGGGT